MAPPPIILRKGGRFIVFSLLTEPISYFAVDYILDNYDMRKSFVSKRRWISIIIKVELKTNKQLTAELLALRRRLAGV